MGVERLQAKDVNPDHFRVDMTTPAGQTQGWSMPTDERQLVVLVHLWQEQKRTNDLLTQLTLQLMGIRRQFDGRSPKSLKQVLLSLKDAIDNIGGPD